MQMQSTKVTIPDGKRVIKITERDYRVSRNNQIENIEKVISISQEETYINTKTGEELKAQTILKRVDRKGFEITYLAYLFDLFELLGNKKMKVFKVILENKNLDNQLMITVRELAEKAEVSFKTAQETLTTLQKKGLIKRRTGGLMVIPKIAHKGDAKREKNLMIRFKEFSDEQTE